MIESIWSHPGRLHQVRETVRHGLRQALKRCELHCVIYRADDLLRLLNSQGQHTMFMRQLSRMLREVLCTAYALQTVFLHETTSEPASEQPLRFSCTARWCWLPQSLERVPVSTRSRAFVIACCPRAIPFHPTTPVLLSRREDAISTANRPQSSLLRGNDVLSGAMHALISGCLKSASLLCVSPQQCSSLSAPRYRPSCCILCAHDVPSSCHAGEKAVFCVLAQRSYASWATVERVVCGSEEESRSFRFLSSAAGMSSRPLVMLSVGTGHRPGSESWAGRTSTNSCEDAHEPVSCAKAKIAARCC